MPVIAVRPGELSGTCATPASKSHALRALAAASMAPGESALAGVPLCDDVVAGRRVFEALGATVRDAPDGLRVTGGAPPRERVLDCGESALCLRLAAALAARHIGRFELIARGSLARRPVAPVIEALRPFGIGCTAHDGRPPLSVQGPLRPGRAAIDAAVTSQALSGLLFALPTASGDSELEVRGLVSRPYIALTLRTLEAFGVRISASPDLSRFAIPGRQVFRAAAVAIEGDWSAAAFLLVAGAIAGEVTVTGLDPESLQADRAVLDALRRSGARVEARPDRVTVTRGRLDAFEADLTDCPDLLPPLAALAVHARGTTRLRGTGRTRYKESDRPALLAREFGGLGARVAVGEDVVEIEGGRVFGGSCETGGDHRIAMALAVAALGAEGPVALRDAGCVDKSYPRFFEDLESLRGGA